MCGLQSFHLIEMHTIAKQDSIAYYLLCNTVQRFKDAKKLSLPRPCPQSIMLPKSQFMLIAIKFLPVVTREELHSFEHEREDSRSQWAYRVNMLDMVETSLDLRHEQKRHAVC